MATRINGSEPKDRFVFDFAITQTQLADATGLTSDHVNRTLQMLRLNGNIEWSRGNVVCIPSWDTLAAFGDFDPEYLQTNVEPEERMRIVKAS